MEIQENIELAPLTYYKIGGKARYFARPERLEDLKKISDFLKEKKVSYFFLGAGSNVLIHDDGFNGLIIHTNKLNKKLEQDENILTVGASVMVIQLLRHCMKTGLDGLEVLVGIPGTMGGVFFMNAGTKLGEIKDLVEEITLFDLKQGTTRRVDKSEIRYSYRTQHFIKTHEIIFEGKVRAISGDPKKVQKKINLLVEGRRKTQPIEKPSCGSVFKNPDPENKIFSWKLIDEAGLRGHQIGNAQISELHTNFIVNLGNAKASDVKALIIEAKKRVKEKFNVDLEEEVQILPPDLPDRRF